MHSGFVYICLFVFLGIFILKRTWPGLKPGSPQSSYKPKLVNINLLILGRYSMALTVFFNKPTILRTILTADEILFWPS